MKYILWLVVQLKACDVTNNNCHLGHHLGFYQELEIRFKLQGSGSILCLTYKITHK